MNQTYVSLDLETTGLNPEVDEIIEIGAVKFQGNKVTDTFHSIVNTQRTLPYRIQLLCGIEQSQLDAAPAFTELADGLMSFIGGCPIVGHNISFDLSFLAQKGLKPANATYDTWELATVLLFRQTDYSLASLTRQLGLSVPQHRALSDAMATKDLFVALLDRALQLDLATLDGVVHLAEKADWGLVRFFREVLEFKAKTAFSGSDSIVDTAGGDEVTLWGEDDEQPLTPELERIPLDVGNLSNIIGPEGILAQTLAGYEHRPGQIQMMEAVAQSLNNCEHLIVEAGTGTGKSIAYLLPSIFFALENGIPVVVSTNTINLQEQLVGKDIPDLLRTLEQWQNPPVKKLKVVQLKGRSNYLCMRKYDAMRASYRLSLDEVKLLARIMVWLLSTQNGDRAELNIGGNEYSTWNKVCAQFDERLEGRCPYRQRGTCFLYRARGAAEKAHLIVVNHALLLSDMVADTKILPPYDHLIIDEAHHLEAEATNQLGSQVTQWDLFSYLNRFKLEVEGQRRTGLLAWLNDCFRGSTVALSRQRQLKQLAESLGNHVDRAHLHVSQFLERLRAFIESHTTDRGGYDRYLLLTWDKRTQQGWSRVETVWEDLDSTLKAIANDLDRLYLGMEDLPDNKVADYDYLMLELSSLFGWSDELRQQMDCLVSHPETDSIYWLVIGGQNDGVELHAAPLNVSGVLEKSLFAPKECVVLTGATLSTESTFEYIKGRLGLEYVNELLLGAPFDYPTSTMIYLPHDIPGPTSASYQQALEKTLIDLCRTCRGRTLVLFTSHAALRATQAAIQAPLEEEGILVLGQGVDGSPKQLQATFKANPETVLLGAASFWEGIDVVGDALSILVIARLPFNVPTDPIFAARSALFDDPFKQYAIPQATIRFKQGFGRLIRSKSDRGVLVVFDRRLQTMNYGSAFLDSIPLCTVVRGSSHELPSHVARWLGVDSQ